MEEDSSDTPGDLVSVEDPSGTPGDLMSVERDLVSVEDSSDTPEELESVENPSGTPGELESVEDPSGTPGDLESVHISFSAANTEYESVQATNTDPITASCDTDLQENKTSLDDRCNRTLEKDSSHVMEEKSVDKENCRESQGACNIEPDQPTNLTTEQDGHSNHDGIVKIPINKRETKGVVRLHNLPAHLEKHSESNLLHSDDELLCLTMGSNQISKSNMTVKANHHYVLEEVDSEAVSHKIPEGDFKVDKNLKDQNKATLEKSREHVLEAVVKESVINVYITWTDAETGDNRTLKWSHQNCDVCCCNFTEWKQHVAKEHGALEENVKNVSSRKLRIPRKLVKTEPPDTDSALLNISVPALVSLKSICEEAAIREEQDPSGRGENLGQSGENLVQNKSEKLLEASVSSLPNEAEWVPHRRKRGRPKKLVIKEDTAKDTLLPIKRKRGQPKIEYEDESEPGSNPEYMPKGQKRLRQKKPVELKPAKVYTCSRKECGVIFDKLKECKAHERNVHGDEMFRCEWCEKAYTTRRDMLQHQFIHTTEKMVPCPLCQKKFTSMTYVNKHLKSHKENTHLCDECDKSFKTQEALDKHKRLHTGQGLLVCQFCGKKMNGKSSLDRHERLHKGEKPYKCEFCDKRFVCFMLLKMHKQEHTGYQFVCAQCGHKFKSKGNLLQHEVSHTSATPYHCKPCGKRFRTPGGLRAHKQAQHSEIKSYICEVCSKAFSSSADLANHKVVHTRERRFECKYCHKRFGTSSTRSGHIKQVHLGEKRTGHQRKGKVKQGNENPRNLGTSTGKKAESGPHGSSDHRGSVSTRQGPETLQGKSVGGLPHQTDPRRSDFYSMVDSFIQFSKEH
ncbi:uncharacterized protein [Amphiura filiformis]|uniref:uncharacterized protein n=1 Tax=Amphiura filiformis TaxID=82378 RepID=UPI003B20B755